VHPRRGPGRRRRYVRETFQNQNNKSPTLAACLPDKAIDALGLGGGMRIRLASLAQPPNPGRSKKVRRSSSLTSRITEAASNPSIRSPPASAIRAEAHAQAQGWLSLQWARNRPRKLTGAFVDEEGLAEVTPSEDTGVDRSHGHA